MTTLSIPEMSCGHCKAAIEQTIKALDPSASLAFDLPARTVAVQTVADLGTLHAALKAAGYEVAA